MRIPMKTTLRATLTVLALGTVFAALTGCAGPYVPSAKDGRCNVGREWVPPAETNGKWIDGYCKEAR